MKYFLILALTLFILFPIIITAQEDVSICMDCHEDEDLTTEKEGVEYSLFINLAHYKNSIHQGLECIDCHSDVDQDDLPHDESLAKVSCGECHDIDQFNISVHVSGGPVSIFLNIMSGLLVFGDSKVMLL